MKNLKKTIILIIALFLTASFSGCSGKKEAAAVNAAFICGIAQNETVLNVETCEEIGALAASPNSTYAFISIDGTPSCIGEAGTIVDLSDRHYTQQMEERVYESIGAEFSETLNTYIPDCNELDMAQAISLGVRTINANLSEDKVNKLILYCSGRSTVGLINMLDTPVNKIDISASVPVIAEKMKTTDMSTIDQVVWYCCGDCGGTQPPLSDNEKGKLKEFYNALFHSLGAKTDVIYKDDLPSEEVYDFSCTVSNIAVEGTGSGLQELTEEALSSEAALNTPLILSEKQIQFQPDTDVFLDEDIAVNAIKPLADFLNMNPSTQVLLYGTCAGDDTDTQLGESRALKVKQVLCDHGVDADRVIVFKLSDYRQDPYYVYHLGTGKEAAVNRKCVVMSTDSELAQTLLGNSI